MKLADVHQSTGALADKRDAGLMNVLLTPIDNALACQVLGPAAGLTLGSSSKAKLKLANNVLALINGKPVLVTAAEVAFTATTHNIADGSINMFALTVDSAGTMYIEAGVAATTLANVKPPVVSKDRAVIGIATIATSGAAFTAATTELDAGTITDLYYDVVGPWATK